VEVGVSVSALLLDGLSRTELSLDLRSGNWIVACIKHVEEVVLVLGHSYGLQLALCGRILATRSGDRRKMNRVDRLNHMEVVVVGDRNLRVREGTTHHFLSVGVSPGIAVETGRYVRVLSLVAIAGRLHLVAAFHLKAIDQWL